MLSVALSQHLIYFSYQIWHAKQLLYCQLPHFTHGCSDSNQWPCCVVWPHWQNVINSYCFSFSVSLSILTATFQVNLGWLVFIEAKDDGGGGDNWTTGAISRANLQSNHRHQQTNIRMPFLSPNQQCQSTEGKISHPIDLLTPSSPRGLPTLSLTTNSSWLPWGRVVIPLISPLMPVPPFSFSV